MNEFLLNKSAEGIQAYNTYRKPPTEEVVAEILLLAGKNQFDLIVDLGSGTGLSTVVWKDYARQVVGIEPNSRFIEVARRLNNYDTVRYVEGWAHKTGLAEKSADIVTAMNSLHWMDLQSAFQEINRILKPGGLFVMLGAFDFTLYDFEATDHSVQLLKEKNLHKKTTIQSEEDVEIYFKDPSLFDGRVEFIMRKKEELAPPELIGRMKTIGFVEACLAHSLGSYREDVASFNEFLAGRYRDRRIPYSTSYDVKIGRKNI